MALPKRKIGNELKKKIENLSEYEEIDENNLNFKTLGNISAKDIGIEIEKLSQNNPGIEQLADEVFDKQELEPSIKQYNHPAFVVKYIELDNLVAAPANWNLWEPQDSVTKAGLVQDIIEIGLLQDIIVWEVDSTIKAKYKIEKDYMILAGHNRTDAFRIINSIAKTDIFNSIRAKVFKNSDLNLTLAKRMIDSTNLWARVKSAKELGQAYVRDAKLVSKDHEKQLSNNKIYEILAERDKKSKSYIREKMDLAFLIDEYDELVGNVLNYKAAVHLSRLSKDIQIYIYDKYYKNLENRHLFTINKIKMIKNRMIYEMIDQTFNNVVVIPDIVERKIDVPYELVKDFDKLIKEFFTANQDFIRK